MFSIKYFFTPLVILLLLLSSNITKAAIGEPVPGIEIYVELDPDDEPLIKGVTNSGGEFQGTFSVTNPNPSKPRTINVSLKFPKDTWKKLADKFKQTKFYGKYEFMLTIVSGKSKIVKIITLEIKNDSDIQNFTKSPSGPYGLAMSNIEDNGKMIGPNNPGKIPFTVTLQLTKPPYGINDEGIK